MFSFYNQILLEHSNLFIQNKFWLTKAIFKSLKIRTVPEPDYYILQFSEIMYFDTFG